MKHTVVIAGDFNFDLINKKPSTLQNLTCGFITPGYEKTRLRTTVSKIDFVAVRSMCTRIQVKNTDAHDLQGNTDQKEITNHNPVSATIAITKDE